MYEQEIKHLTIWKSTNPLLDMRLADWRDLGGIVVEERIETALERVCEITDNLDGGEWEIKGRKLTFEVQWLDKPPDHFLFRVWMLYRVPDPGGVIWSRCQMELKHYFWERLTTVHIDQADEGDGVKEWRAQAGHYLAGGRRGALFFLNVAEMDGKSLGDRGTYLGLRGYGGAVADAVATYVWRPLFREFTPIIVRPSGNGKAAAFLQLQSLPYSPAVPRSDSLVEIRSAVRNVTDVSANVPERTHRLTKPGVPIGDAARILIKAGVPEDDVQKMWENWCDILKKGYLDPRGSWRGVIALPPSRSLKQISNYLPPQIIQEVEDKLAGRSIE